MRYRHFGGTGLQVSERGFGGWAIGGTSFGRVERTDALRALARAEELGCNFVDTAAVYGASEEILGEFLPGRRDRWVLASKYSGQPEGMTATVEAQLRRLRTDTIDFYQLHWVPRAREQHLYDELASLRQAGKVRFIGVSLYTTDDIDFVLAGPRLDGIQVAFSLLDPLPVYTRVDALAASGLAVIARSALRGGLLSGRYARGATFDDPRDQRSRIEARELDRILGTVDRFRFLGGPDGSLLAAALGYPLAFSAVSTVILSTKSEAQAQQNFGRDAVRHLSPDDLARIAQVQKQLGLLDDGIAARLKRWTRRVIRR